MSVLSDSDEDSDEHDCDSDDSEVLSDRDLYSCTYYDSNSDEVDIGRRKPEVDIGQVMQELDTKRKKVGVAFSAKLKQAVQQL